MEYKLLEKLCLSHGVTGDTEEIEAFLKNHLNQLGIQYNQLGYGVIVIGNLKNPQKMISAHIDEVGFQITKIDDDGKIRILPIGWIFANRLDHCVVYINTKNKKIRGLVLHQETLKTENLEHFGSMFIDVGANSKTDVEKMGIRVGQTGAYQREYWENNGTLIATGMDNRVSVFAMLTIIEENPNLLKDNLFAFVVDEEMMDHSANGLCHQYQPVLAVILDYCPVHQKAGDGDVLGEVTKGPIITYRGGSHIIHKKAREFFDKKIKTPFQKIFLASTTVPSLEPANFQNNGETIAVNICIPAYGYHGAAYSVRKIDLENYIKLIKEILSEKF